MRLLILTQKVDINDPILGFFHRWIEEFSRHAEQITVIALGVGEYHLPDNVRVFSLGKPCYAEASQGMGNFPLSTFHFPLLGSVVGEQLRKLKYVFNFYRFIWRERKNYDVVFVHMNPIYVILGGLVWRMLGKRIGLWYTHKHVDLKLRIAEKFTDVIFTASPESFRYVHTKVKVMGHGIDTEVFSPIEKREAHTSFRVVTAGRISPIKDYQTLVEAIEILASESVPVLVDIIGSHATVADEHYLKSLHVLVQEKKLDETIRFVGSVPNRELPERLRQADIFVNMSRTGSLDKAVLEAMACGVPVVTSNEALTAVFGIDAPALIFTVGSARACAEHIKRVKDLSPDARRVLSGRLRATVEREHNIEMLIPRILSSYETTNR